VSFSPTLNTLIERMPYRPYCSDSLSEGVHVRKKEIALNSKFFQFNPPSQVQAFCVDIDNRYAFEAADNANVLPPSIFVENKLNGHGHGIYILKTPITVSSKARMLPQRWLAGIERGFTRRIGGDRGYRGLLCRNPLTHQIIDTGRLYSLDELDSCLDFEDKSPYFDMSEETGAGRNVTMFDKARFTAYRIVNNYPSHTAFHKAVFNECEKISYSFSVPLPYSEVKATAKSVAKWTWARRNQFQSRTEPNRGAYGCSRAEAGVITAARRKTATAVKIQQAIKQLSDAGQKPTPTAIAREVGIGRMTVYRWLEQYKTDYEQ